MDFAINLGRRVLPMVKASWSDSLDSFGGTEIEKKVKLATNSDKWGVNGSVKMDIAHATEDYVQFKEVMTIIWRRTGEADRHWRRIYKTLLLIEDLLRHGSERVAEDVRRHDDSLMRLSRFAYLEDGKDVGVNIRAKAERILSLVGDAKALKKLRAEAKKTQGNTVGLSSDGLTSGGGSGGRFGAMSSSSSYSYDSYEGDNPSFADKDDAEQQDEESDEERIRPARKATAADKKKKAAKKSKPQEDEEEQEEQEEEEEEEEKPKPKAKKTVARKKPSKQEEEEEEEEEQQQAQAKASSLPPAKLQFKMKKSEGTATKAAPKSESLAKLKLGAPAEEEKPAPKKKAAAAAASKSAAPAAPVDFLSLDLVNDIASVQQKQSPSKVDDDDDESWGFTSAKPATQGAPSQAAANGDDSDDDDFSAFASSPAVTSKPAAAPVNAQFPAKSSPPQTSPVDMFDVFSSAPSVSASPVYVSPRPTPVSPSTASAPNPFDNDFGSFLTTSTAPPRQQPVAATVSPTAAAQSPQAAAGTATAASPKKSDDLWESGLINLDLSADIKKKEAIAKSNERPYLQPWL